MSGQRPTLLAEESRFLGAFLDLPLESLQAFRLQHCRRCQGQPDPTAQAAECLRAGCGLCHPTFFAIERQRLAEFASHLLTFPRQPDEDAVALFAAYVHEAGCTTPAPVKNAQGHYEMRPVYSTLRGAAHAVLLESLGVHIGATVRINVAATTVREGRAVLSQEANAYQEAKRHRVVALRHQDPPLSWAKIAREVGESEDRVKDWYSTETGQRPRARQVSASRKRPA